MWFKDSQVWSVFPCWTGCLTMNLLEYILCWPCEAFIGPEDGFMWRRQVELQAKANPTDAPEWLGQQGGDAVLGFVANSKLNARYSQRHEKRESLTIQQKWGRFWDGDFSSSYFNFLTILTKAILLQWPWHGCETDAGQMRWVALQCISNVWICIDVLNLVKGWYIQYILKFEEWMAQRDPSSHRSQCLYDAWALQRRSFRPWCFCWARTDCKKTVVCCLAWSFPNSIGYCSC